MHLLIVAASARYMAASALGGGFDVSAVDLFADWDLLQIVPTRERKCFGVRKVGDFDELLDVLDWAEIDAVVIGGGVENRIEVVKRLVGQLELLGPQPKQLARLHNPASLPVIAEIVKTVGGCFPETKTNLPPTDRPTEWLKKNPAGAGGRHVSIVSANSIGMESLQDLSTVFQQKILGSSLSAVYVASPIECRLIGISRQLVGDTRFAVHPFSYCGSIGPLEMSVQKSDVVQRIGNAISKEFEIVGVFGIDFIQNEHGIWLVDINPRIPASAEIFEWARITSNHSDSFSIVRLHVESCQGKSLSDELPFDSLKFFGKAILFCQTSAGVTIDENNFEKIVAFYCEERGQANRWVADVPNVGTEIKQGEPILSLFVRGSDEQQVDQRLADFASSLRRMIESD